MPLGVRFDLFTDLTRENDIVPLIYYFKKLLFQIKQIYIIYKYFLGAFRVAAR